MLKNIKSTYLLKYIFSFLEITLKSKLFEYNKKIQKKLELDPYNIKKIIGKYKLYEKDIVKEIELNTDLLLFEGNYSNGKRSGNGKEYNNDGKIIFEGKYLNGQRNGIGRELYSLLQKNEEKVKYYGLYLNGKRHGTGKEFYFNGKLKFEGEYLNGKMWNGKGYNNNGDYIFNIKNGFGKIKEYSDFGNLIYTGYYKDGERDGIGSENYFNQKLKFTGQYYKGKRWKGIGYDIEGNKIFYIYDGIGIVKEYTNVGILTFEGIYSHGMKFGTGKEYYKDGELKFSGKYSNDQRNGFGKEYYKKGNLSYKGNFWNNKRHGKGNEYYEDGNLKYEGNFFYGKIFGYGIEYNHKKQKIFKGEYINDKRWKGTLYKYNEKNKIELEEEYIKGKLTGKIIKKIYYESGVIKFSGEFFNGEKNGKGEEYNKEGILIYKGEFYKGLRHGEGKEYDSNGKLLYIGKYVKGTRDIYGEEYDNNSKLLYKGEYIKGKRHGKGTLFNKGKIVFKGEFQFGWKIKGTIYKYFYNERIKFIGDYLKNNITGKGTEYNLNGEKIFEGDFAEGERHGFGRIYEKNNVIYEGEFQKGRKFGFGRGYNINGILKYEILIINANKGYIRFFNADDKMKSEYEYTKVPKYKYKIKFNNELNEEFLKKGKILDEKFGNKKIKKKEIKLNIKKEENIEKKNKNIMVNTPNIELKKDGYEYYECGMIKGND